MTVPIMSAASDIPTDMSLDKDSASDKSGGDALPEAAYIHANLEMIFEDLDNIENKKVRLVEEARQKEWAEKGQVDDVKASALGHLHAVMAFRGVDKSSSHPSMAPLVSRSNVASLGEQSAETTPSVAGVDARPVTTHWANHKSTTATEVMGSLVAVVAAMEHGKHERLEAKKIAVEEREKRQLLQAENQQKRLALEEKWLEIQEHNQQAQFELQQQQQQQLADLMKLFLASSKAK